ncbi:MAG: serine transporter [Endozoicomonadaceae bacterium]|nr:serine transporter [Endozoicomonadaceae bacterium]
MTQIKKYLDRKDVGWLATLFGTAVGAGVLYLPVRAAKAGLIPLIVVTLLSIPAIWMAHRNLTWFCLSATDPKANITGTVVEKFGRKAGGILTLSYFMSIYPILLLYGIGLTNVIHEMITTFSTYSPPARSVSSFIILSVLTFVIIKGEKWVSAACEMLVFPLVLILFFCAVYFIPIWQKPTLSSHSWLEFIKLSVLMAPLLVFSFNHSPSCSAFAQAYRLQYKDMSTCHMKTSRVLKFNIVLLLVTILPFVFSCVFSMTAQDVAYAVKYNIPALISISAAGYISWMPIVISIITLLAITSSFFGVYIGSHEGATGLVDFIIKNTSETKSPQATKNLNIIIHIFLFITNWIVASFNISVITIIQALVAPVLAIILFIMPVISMYLVKEMKVYRSPLADLYIFIFGLIVIFGFLISMIIK